MNKEGEIIGNYFEYYKNEEGKKGTIKCKGVYGYLPGTFKKVYDFDTDTYKTKFVNSIGRVGVWKSYDREGKLISEKNYEQDITLFKLDFLNNGFIYFSYF